MATKTKIARSKLDNHPMKDISADFIRKSGQCLKPPEHEYQASAVVHFYAYKGNLFAFIAHQTGLNTIPEQQASAGLKELGRAMMSVFGRKATDAINPNIQIVDNL